MSNSVNDLKKKLKTTFLNFVDIINEKSIQTDVLKVRCVIKNFVHEQTIYETFKNALTDHVISSIKTENEDIFVDKSIFLHQIDKTGTLTNTISTLFISLDESEKKMYLNGYLHF